jgi:hypothetical protein
MLNLGTGWKQMIYTLKAVLPREKSVIPNGENAGWNQKRVETKPHYKLLAKPLVTELWKLKFCVLC